MSAGFKELEAKYKQERRTIDRIEHPRVLCIASKQCCEPKFKFDLDVQVLQKVFPDCLVVERDITSTHRKKRHLGRCCTVKEGPNRPRPRNFLSKGLGEEYRLFRRRKIKGSRYSPLIVEPSLWARIGAP